MRIIVCLAAAALAKAQIVGRRVDMFDRFLDSSASCSRNSPGSQNTYKAPATAGLCVGAGTYCSKGCGEELETWYAGTLGLTKKQVKCNASPNAAAGQQNCDCQKADKYYNNCCVCAKVDSPAPAPTPAGTKCTDLPGYACTGGPTCEDPGTCAYVCNRLGLPPGICSGSIATCDVGGQKCCSCVSTGANDDPWMNGLHGQSFLFEGKEGAWYSLIHDPEQINVNMRIHNADGKDTTFIDGLGFTIQSEDGEEYRISMAVTDNKNFNPKCPSKKEVCIGEGGFKLEIQEDEVTKPGFTQVSDDISFVAMNTPWFCKLIPESHNHWDEIEAAKRDARMQNSRRGLTIMEPEIDYLHFIGNSQVFDPKKCAEWIEERKEKRDLFDQSGSASTMFLSTNAFTMRIEYTLTLDTKWVNHHRFDISFLGYKASVDENGKALTSGILGETAELKVDPVLNAPAISGRDRVLSGPDADYEVDGPYGQEFTARKSV